MKLTYVNNIQSTSYGKPQKAAILDVQTNNYKNNNVGHRLCVADTVSFCGVKGITMGPFLKSTYEKTRALYDNYKELLGETSQREIIESVNSVSEATGHSKTEVMNAMQQLTQFANMRSIQCVADAMSNKKISYIGTSHNTNMLGGFYFQPSEMCPELNNVFMHDFGIQRTFDYLLDKKQFASLDNKTAKRAIFLDEASVSRLEKLKEKNPKLLEKYRKISEFQFFMLSGWDSGITFLDRTKNLETETIKLLNKSDELGMQVEDVLDAPLLKRITALGINPTVIRREGVPTVNCIYNQMAPEQMTEDELLRVIDANARVKTTDYIQQLKYKDKSVDYLEKNLQVYTPERLSSTLKRMHKHILSYAQKRNYKPEDILYVEPFKVKSSSLINYSYQKINGIPSEQFTDLFDINSKRKNIDGKMLVFLDDCTITGDSAEENMEKLRFLPNKKTPSLFAFVCGTSAKFRCFPRKYNNDIYIEDYIGAVSANRRHLYDRRLEQIVGTPEYTHGMATSLVFPYMAPDNNTKLASNIALLHDYLYKTSMNKQSKARIGGIKSMASSVVNIATEANRNIAVKPVILEEDIKTIEKQNPKPLKQRIKEKFDDIINLL